VNFFEQLVAAPVPLDLRAVRALKRSPLALDLYGAAGTQTLRKAALVFEAKPFNRSKTNTTLGPRKLGPSLVALH
jgi:hypothetical protein